MHKEDLEKLSQVALEEARREGQERLSAYKDWMRGYCERVLPNLREQLTRAKSESKKLKILGRIAKWEEIEKALKDFNPFR